MSRYRVIVDKHLVEVDASRERIHYVAQRIAGFDVVGHKTLSTGQVMPLLKPVRYQLELVKGIRHGKDGKAYLPKHRK